MAEFRVKGRVSPPGAPWGVNIVGYFRSEAGTGEAARQVASALDGKGVPVLPIHGNAVPVSRQGYPYDTAAPNNARYGLNLICMNADMLPEFAREAGERFFARRYSIGLWFWELDQFPERWIGSFSLLEEVWAPTAHIADALERDASVPINTIRVPVVPAKFRRRTLSELGFREAEFSFLFSFDYLSVAERKNPLATVAAYCRAFDAHEGARLLIKCVNAEHNPDYHSQLRTAVAGRPDIELVERYLSAADNSNLTALCDCYVSMHRAEGFGLGMAEAMWHGKPVIATGYSGNLDFMTTSNSLLVEYRLVEIGDGADPYPANGMWADPDIVHASRLMRRVFDDRVGAQELGRRAAIDIRATHSPEVAGEIMCRRLAAIHATGRWRQPDAHEASPLRRIRLGIAWGASMTSARWRRTRRLARQVRARWGGSRR